MRWYSLVGVAIAIIAYTVIGGVIFSYLEQDHEEIQRNEVFKELEEFFADKTCLEKNKLGEVHGLLTEMKLSGISVHPSGELVNRTNWDIRAAIFVALQLIATIGFPSAAPQSDGGRAFTVPYAIFGIPLFLITAIGMGSVLNALAEWLRKLFVRHCCDPCTPECGARLFRTLVIFLLGLVLFVVVPSLIFVQIEPWTYGDAFYFCFITISTIGFGDLVPSYNDQPWMSEEYKNWYRLAIAFWILILSAWFASVLVSIQRTVTSAALSTENKIYGQRDEDNSSNIWSDPVKTTVGLGNTEKMTVQNGSNSNDYSQYLSPISPPRDTSSGGSNLVAQGHVTRVDI